MLKGSARLLSHRHIILNHNDSYEVISMEVVAGFGTLFYYVVSRSREKKRRRREWTRLGTRSPELDMVRDEEEGIAITSKLVYFVKDMKS